MAENNRWIIILIILLLILVGWQFFKEKPPLEQGISVRFYDINGNLINTPTFTIVEGIPGVYYIDLTVNIRNNGNVNFDECSIFSATPQPFNDALTKTLQILPIGQTKSWTSAKIAVAQFESYTQPVRFNADIECKYNTNSLRSSGNIDLTFEKETTGFDVTVVYRREQIYDNYIGSGSSSVDQNKWTFRGSLGGVNQLDNTYIIGGCNTCGFTAGTTGLKTGEFETDILPALNEISEIEFQTETKIWYTQNMPVRRTIELKLFGLSIYSATNQDETRYFSYNAKKMTDNSWTFSRSGVVFYTGFIPTDNKIYFKSEVDFGTGVGPSEIAQYVKLYKIKIMR